MNDHVHHTEQQLADVETPANAATAEPWGIYEYGTDGSVIDITAEVLRLRAEAKHRTEDLASAPAAVQP